jgi:voltage-gated potassium channel
MFNYLQAFLVSFKRPAMVFIVFLMLTIVISSAALIFKFEAQLNDEINSYFDALYLTVTIITGVGLGDIAPITFYGRLVSMFVMLAGTSLFVGATALIASSIIQIENERRSSL